MATVIRVLIVDDDADAAELTATYLERISQAIETTVETEPTDALAHISGSERVDCVVSDYDMPEANGLEFLDDVRAIDPDLPFVLFTGKGSEEIASEAISAGVTDYLQKESGTEQYGVLANRIENAVAQHRAEREAAEADRQIRRIFERVTDAFYALDEEWRFTYVNEQAASYTDYSREELVGTHIRSLLPESEAEAFYDAFERAFESQRPVTLETQSVLQPDRWVAVRIYPSEDGLSVYFRDTTDRKKTRRELRDTKQKIEALHAVAARAVACTTTGDIYDLAIEAAEEILEFDLCVVDAVEDDTLVPRAVSKGLPSDAYYDTTPVDAENSLAARAHRESESSVVGDVRQTAAVPAESDYRSVLTVPIGDSAVFQAVSEDSDAFDERDRERTELLAVHLGEALARVESEKRLRAERDRFASLFENVPNPVVRYEIVDDEAVGRSVNTAFEEVFGWSEAEVVGESVDDYILPDEEWAAGQALNARVEAGDRVEGVEVHRNTRDGGRDFLLHTAPIGEGGEAFAIYIDIAAQKERERKLARQNERLEEFASVVSHDLRNPLNVAKGRYELLAERCDDENLDALGRALDRMDSLVASLLTMARHGQAVDRTEPISLADAAEAAWETAQTGEATLSIGADATLEADESRLRELLENLFRNAVEHGSTGSRPSDDDVHRTESDAAHQNPEDSEDAVEHGSTSTQPAAEDAVEHGSPDGRPSGADGAGDVSTSDHTPDADAPVAVEVGTIGADDARSAADRVTQGFYVADDGSGIPADDREQVFEHGYTTADEGTGFGLAIVDSIADAHGWEAAVAESDTGGARFEFTRVASREPPDA